MAVTRAQINRLYHQIETEISTFSGQLDKLDVAHYPDARAKEIVKYLREKLNKYRQTAINIKGEWQVDPEGTIRKFTTSIHNPLMQEDTQFLDWLRSAQTENVPWSLTPLIEQLANGIIPSHKLLTCCVNQYNYMITWTRSPNLAPYPYTILALPRLHRTNFLWHALLGHELFHPRCDEFIDKHNKTVLAKMSEELRNHFPLKENEELYRKDYEKRLDRLAEKARFVWRRAMEELLSDMTCVELFGPAAIMAMRAFFASSSFNTNPSSANNYYPSPRFRFEVIYKYSVKGNFLDDIYRIGDDKPSLMPLIESFKQEMRAMQILVSTPADGALPEQDTLIKIAYGCVNNLLSEASQFVQDTLAPLSISKWHQAVVLEQIPVLLERLLNGIPPNEIIKQVDETPGRCQYETVPAEFTAILVAGWIFETYWQETFDPNNPKMSYLTMSRLLLKACEDISTMKQKEVRGVCSDKACNPEGA